MNYTDMSRFFKKQNNRVFSLTLLKPLKKGRVLTAVDPAWFLPVVK